MNQIDIAKLIEHFEQYAKEKLKDIDSGHDYQHALRVRKAALEIAAIEGGDLVIIELSSLLHDCIDSKFFDSKKELQLINDALLSEHLDDESCIRILHVIENISFTSQKSGVDSSSLEVQIVRDADRLDALGAIGIARTFNYGGFKKRIFFDENIFPANYPESTEPTINHFFEKLFRLKDMMHTQTARQVAIARHLYLYEFLKQFFSEWQFKSKINQLKWISLIPD